MAAFLLLSLICLVLSVFALLVAVGATLRVQRVEQRFAAPAVGLPAGAAVPSDALVSFLQGQDVSNWLRGPSLVILASQKCPACRDLIENINRRAVEIENITERILIIERGADAAGSLRGAAKFNALWAVDTQGRAGEAFQTGVSPHTFLIRDEKIALQKPGSAIESLLRVPGTAMAGA